MLFLIDHELTLSEVQEWIGQRYVTNKKGKKKKSVLSWGEKNKNLDTTMAKTEHKKCIPKGAVKVKEH